MKIIDLHHLTLYDYGDAVYLGPQLIRLYPRRTIEKYKLRIWPEPYKLHWHRDPWGQKQVRATWDRTHSKRLHLSVKLRIKLAPMNPFDFFVDDTCVQMPVRYGQDLGPFLHVDGGPRLEEVCSPWLGKPSETVARLVEINQWVAQNIGYAKRPEGEFYHPEETLEKAQGSCRDTAWLLTNMARRLGLAARFVSGYLILPVKTAELHAWSEVYLEGAGWVGMDPTSGYLTTEAHLPICGAPRPELAAPVTGWFAGTARDTLEHRVTAREWQ